MITLDAFLVFLAAASLPVIYLFLVSRWVEPEYRNLHAANMTANAASRNPSVPDRKAA